MKTLLLVLSLLALPTLVQAQTTLIRPQFGGYAITTPDQPPTYVRPMFNGYIALTPDQPPTYVRPMFNGWAIYPPVRQPAPFPPLTAVPSQGNSR